MPERTPPATPPDERLEIGDAIAVVTGGASGIGKAIARALLRRGATVVVADIEDGAIEAAVTELAELSGVLGGVSGRRTDVTDEASVHELAEHVFATHGRCNLFFANAGVTSGGGGKPWQQEPNDWRWCFGVNVFGVGICASELVPRMLASGEPGQFIVTSSSDGGFAPVPQASVYAASKAAASCFAESLNANLISEGGNVRASVLYPFGGLLDTGLFNAQRNRPTELQRVGAGTGRQGMSFEQLKELVAKATGAEPPVADLHQLGEEVVDRVAERRFIIGGDLSGTAAMLHRRADAIARAEMPENTPMDLR